MATELTFLKRCAFMPSAGRGVIHPSGVGRRENQHVERVAVLLIRIRDGVRQISVVLDGELNRMGRNAHALIALCAVYDALSTGV